MVPHCLQVDGATVTYYSVAELLTGTFRPRK